MPPHTPLAALFMLEAHNERLLAISACIKSAEESHLLDVGSAQPLGTLQQLQDSHTEVRTRALLQQTAGSSNVSAAQV